MSKKKQTPSRVLFVDDDPQFLQATQELMSAFSGGEWEISTAESASKAFSLLQDKPIDLAVLDVQMGVMDGIQMLSLLNRGYPNVQKVVLTGFANEKYRAACLSNGVELFLEKPTTQEGWRSLYSALNEVLRFKPEEGFRGVLRRVGLQDVIQMECLARNSSVLEISNAQMHGKIYIETGQIIHAQVGELSGEAAFNRLLGLTGGQFNLRPFSEPPARTTSGPWEFLLMEAARKRDEASESAETSGVAEASEETAPPTMEEPPAEISPVVPAEESPDELVIVDAETGEPIETLSEPVSEKEPAPSVISPGATRPKIQEMLICSAQGEVVHEWQCRNVDLWINFFEFLSQRAQRLAQALPLGNFDRLEIHNNGLRTVVIISADKGVMVKSQNVSAG